MSYIFVFFSGIVLGLVLPDLVRRLLERLKKTSKVSTTPTTTSVDKTSLS